MTEAPGTSAPELAKGNRRLAVLLAMAMFVLVVDTSVMNVSISAVVHDLHTTVSGVQSAIALEALVSAAFILIGSKVGDLIGRKRAYVLGLLGYGIGALAMALSQGLVAIIVFWAIVGGIGASLLLPSMQALIHGNFEGAAQRQAYALVGAAAAIDTFITEVSTTRTNIAIASSTASLRFPVDSPAAPVPGASVMESPRLLKSFWSGAHTAAGAPPVPHPPVGEFGDCRAARTDQRAASRRCLACDSPSPPRSITMRTARAWSLWVEPVRSIM